MTDDPTRRALLRAAAGSAAAGAAGCVELSTPADVSRSADAFERRSHVVGPSWLADRREETTVLDARAERAFRHERIRGARRIDVDALLAREERGEGRVPDADALASALGAAGVPEEDVVVYGDGVGPRATRVVFALEYLAHGGENAVLNGGFDAWTGRVGTGSRSVEGRSYPAEPDDERVVTREWLAERLDAIGAEEGAQLVDVRAPEAYLGATGAPELDPDNERHGHVPGAVNVHWKGNATGRRFRPPEDLAELYLANAGLEPERTTVVYGDDGLAPTTTYVVLRALGFEDVRLYDAGFGEWANVDERDRHPVEAKDHAVINVEGDGGDGGGDGGFSCT